MKRNQSNVPARGEKAPDSQPRCAPAASREQEAYVVFPDAILANFSGSTSPAKDDSRQGESANPGSFDSRPRDESGQSPALQFVMVDEPIGSGNQSYRRAIRSHVMRGIHSKRREKNSLPARKHTLLSKGGRGKNDSLSNSGVSGSSPESDSTVVSSRTSQDNSHLPNSTTGSSTPAEPSIQSRTTANSGSSSRRILWDTTDPSASLILGADVPDEIQDVSKATEQAVALGTAFPESSSSYRYFDRWNFNTTTPYALLQIEGGPPLCMNSRGWPFPQPLGTNGPKISMWMAGQNIPAPIIGSSRPCLHQNVQVLPYIGNSAEYFLFKGQTIKWINSRLSNPAYSTSDVTIGSILQLISFEAGKGSAEEAAQHISGLERIVALRGGIENFTHDKHLLLKIMLLDLLVAIKTNTEPRFQLTSSMLPHPITRHDLCTALPVCADSPLYRSDQQLSDILLNSPFSPKNIQLMQYLQDLTLFQLRPPSLGTETRSAIRASIHGLLSSSTPPSSALSQVLHLTSYLHFLALSNPPTIFSSSSNHQTALKLIHLLESPENDLVFDTYPGIFLWILLVASAASENGLKEHAFVVSVLLKVANGSAYGWWMEMSQALRCFGGMKRVCEVGDWKFDM